MRHSSLMRVIAGGAVALLAWGCAGVNGNPTTARSLSQGEELAPGYGTFTGSLNLTVMKLQNGESVIAPFGSFHKAAGTVTYRKADGTLRTITVDSAVPRPTPDNPNALGLFNAKDESQGDPGVVLLDFKLDQKAHYYGRVVDAR